MHLEEGWSCAGSGRGAEVCRQCLVRFYPISLAQQSELYSQIDNIEIFSKGH